MKINWIASSTYPLIIHLPNLILTNETDLVSRITKCFPIRPLHTVHYCAVFIWLGYGAVVIAHLSLGCLMYSERKERCFLPPRTHNKANLYRFLVIQTIRKMNLRVSNGVHSAYSASEQTAHLDGSLQEESLATKRQPDFLKASWQ